MNKLRQFVGLLIFGNIENLILASQGVGAGVNPFILSCLTFIAVIIWFLIGTFGTKAAMKYSRHINFIGGFAIFILGIQSMAESLPSILAALH